MNLQTLQQREDKFLFDMKTLMEVATKDARPLTDEEKKSYDAWEKGLADVGKQIERFKSDEEATDKILSLTGHRRGPSNTPTSFLVSPVTTYKTFGQRWVETKEFAWHKETKGSRAGQWHSPSVEIERKALTEDPTSGGALVPPDVQSTIVSGPVLPIVVADLLAPGTTSSNLVPVTVEKTYTSAAAPTAEGALKPESSLTFELQQEAVRKLAHWIPISEELLEDAPAVASYVDARLRYGLLREEDQQLLSGTGTPPELLGLLNRSGLGADVPRGSMTNSDAILAAIVQIETTTGLPVSGVIMNPLAWSAIIGHKLTDGDYLGGGPLAPPTPPMIWNRPVALTDQITSTVALVGAFKTACQVFRHGGVKVSSTNAHSDFYVRNLVAVRCEERLALSCTRPSALCKVTGLTTTLP